MHQHFADMTTAIDLGQRSDLRHYGSIPSVPSSGATPTKKIHKVEKPATETPAATTPTSVTAAEHKAELAAASTPAGIARRAAVEIIKNGSVSTAEHQAMQGNDEIYDAILDERGRLETSLADTFDTPGIGSPYGTGNQYRPGSKSDHTELVERLGSDDSRTIAEIDAALAVDGIDSYTKQALEDLRAQRLADENDVADVIQDRVALIGTLEAEKVAIADGSAGSAEDVLDAGVRDAFETFVENGGQVHTGWNWFQDEWNEVGDRTDLNSVEALAEHFRKHPDQLDEFLSKQGIGDGAIDSAGSVREHVQDLVADGKLEEAVQVDERYDAAYELKQAFEEYNELYATGSTDAGRIEEIDTQITELETLNDRDVEVLSAEVRRALNSSFVADPSALPQTDAATPTTPTPESQNNGAPETDATGETRPVLYTSPEAQQEVLSAAQAAGLLPANTSVASNGSVTYTVKPGQGYWHIAADVARSEDSSYFWALYGALPAANGNQGLNPNDQVVIPGRSIQELVQLLGLPTTEAIPPTPHGAI